MTEQHQERARALADRYWEGFLELEPLFATMVGDERFDDQLADPGEQGRRAREELNRAALDDLATIDRPSLDVTLRTTMDVLEACAARELDWIGHRLDRLQVVSHLWGPAQLLAELATMQRADTPERLERYLARLRRVPEYFRAVGEVAEDGIRAGVTAPRVVVERTIAQAERFVAILPQSSPALTPVSEEDERGRAGVTAILRDDVMPAYERFLATLRDYLPHATETLGLSSLPNGDEMYASQILAWTTMPLTAQEVHDLGIQDLARIQDERRGIASVLGHPTAEEALAAYDATGENVAKTRDELVRLAEKQVQRGWDAAPSYFGRLPSSNCEVRLVEEFREADMPGAWYQQPSEDGSRAGIYFINAYDLPTRPLHHLATTTYHEANPGHHFQVAIEQEMADRPSLRRFGGILGGSAFIEGWGLYSERLADEMGLFENEYERLGMLEAQGHRAARLIVDTGIHAMGWDRDRAIAKLQEAGVPRTDAEIETDRYITSPGQALSYKVGQIEVERWRREAAEREGDGFSLKDFHDRLLALGSLPLPSIERELASWPGPRGS